MAAPATEDALTNAPSGIIYQSQKPIRFVKPSPRRPPLVTDHNRRPRCSKACGVSRSRWIKGALSRASTVKARAAAVPSAARVVEGVAAPIVPANKPAAPPATPAPATAATAFVGQLDLRLIRCTPGAATHMAALGPHGRACRSSPLASRATYRQTKRSPATGCSSTSPAFDRASSSIDALLAVSEDQDRLLSRGGQPGGPAYRASC